MHKIRCHRLVFLAVAGLAALVSSAAVAEKPGRAAVRLIFDTDMGNDIDDALALGMIHALADRGECELLAVTLSKDNEYSAPFVDVVNTFFGRGDVPIGVVRPGPTPADSKYTRSVVTATDAGRQRFPHDLLSGRDAPEAVGLLRKVLAAQPDHSVVVAVVGFSTNLARLLDSGPDAVSPLDGRALVGRKVTLLSPMAGAFGGGLVEKRHREYNVMTDVASAQNVFSRWPTPIVASGYEIGRAIMYPAQSIREDYGYVPHHPLKEAYELYQKMPYDRPTWDLTSVLYAVRPGRGYFQLSQPGRIVVDDDGFTQFRPEPNGPHCYLVVSPKQVIRVKEALVMLSSQPPRGK